MTAIDKYILRATLSLAIVILSLTALAQTPASIKTVKVTPEIAEAEVGQQLQFAYQALDAEGNPVNTRAFIWIAIPSDRAAADNTGKVTFFGPGEIRVIALVAGKPGMAKINVKPARVNRVDVARLNAPLVVGGTSKLKAKPIGSSGDPREDVTLSWSSESSSVAVVDAAGLVTGVAPGKAKLVARADGASGELTIEVVNSSVRSVAIEPRTTTARAGDVIHFSAQAKDASGKAITDAVVRWAVSGEGAAVESDGGFIAERPGAYVVSATVGAQSAVATVVIAPRNVERLLEMAGRISLKDLQTAEQWLFGNYIYVSTIWDQVQVYDISDPKNPKLTETVKVDARIVNDVSVTSDGRIGVMTREGASNRKNGIVFLDTSDPARPKITSEYTETVTGGVHSAFIDGHYVYLTDDATGSMRVIDFKDVKNPKEVARWQTEGRG